MPKFYQTQKFKELEQRWREKLKKEGFEDLEYNQNRNHSRLRGKNKRTIAFQNRERIRTFYLLLEEVLRKERLPKRDRKILELLVKGVPQVGKDSISSRLQLARSHIHRCVTYYRRMIISKY